MNRDIQRGVARHAPTFQAAAAWKDTRRYMQYQFLPSAWRSRTPQGGTQGSRFRVRPAAFIRRKEEGE